MNLKEVSQFYHHLAINVHAGVSLISFFEQLRATSNNSTEKEKILQVLRQLQTGKSLHLALKTAQFVPLFDLPILEAAEKSGRLVQIAKMLSEKYDLSASTAKEIRSGLMFPLLLISFALFLPDLPRIFLQELTLQTCLLKNLSIISIILLGVAGVYSVFMRSYYNLNLARWKHQIFLKIPLLKTLVVNSAHEAFCSALEIMLESGIPILDALKLAGDTSADERLQLATRRIIGALKMGRTLPQAFQVESIFGLELQRAVITGWQSGELPAMLRQQAEDLRRQNKHLIAQLSKVVPAVIYWGALLFAVGSVAQLYLNNLKNIMTMFGDI